MENCPRQGLSVAVLVHPATQLDLFLVSRRGGHRFWLGAETGRNEKQEPTLPNLTWGLRSGARLITSHDYFGGDTCRKRALPSQKVFGQHCLCSAPSLQNTQRPQRAP